jgi:cytoskeletal protein CcmA (bactofilin family)
MFSTSHAAPSQPVPTNPPSIIWAAVTITGILHSDGDIQIDGKVEGNIRGAGVTIGESAVIRGEIIAECLILRGRVEGNIRARRLVLTKSCHIEGDILHESLEVEAGAFIQGSFRHSAEPLAQALPPPKQPSRTVPDPRSTAEPVRPCAHPAGKRSRTTICARPAKVYPGRSLEVFDPFARLAAKRRATIRNGPIQDLPLFRGVYPPPLERARRP